MVLEHIGSQERVFLSVLVSKPVIVVSDIWVNIVWKENTTQHQYCNRKWKYFC